MFTNKNSLQIKSFKINTYFLKKRKIRKQYARIKTRTRYTYKNELILTKT